MTDSHTMASVKTTISLPEELFKRIERYRKRAKVSRSEAMAAAAERFFREMDQNELSRRVNDVFSDPDIAREQSQFAELDSKAFARLLKDNPW